MQRVLSGIEHPTISLLVEVELHSAVSRKVRVGDLRSTAGRRILALFRRHIVEGRYHHVPLEDEDYRVAKRWLGDFAIPLQALDALHLAVATTNDLTLLTSDAGLISAAKKLGIRHQRVA